MSNVTRAAIGIIALELMLIAGIKTDEPEKCYTDEQCELLFTKNLQLAKESCTSSMDVVEIPNNFGSYYDCEGIVIMESE